MRHPPQAVELVDPTRVRTLPAHFAWLDHRLRDRLHELQLEAIALKDDYFVGRKLYPNVDFYSGLIYQAMKFPVDMFPVLFAIPRTAGWLAQWEEMLQDKDQKIARPRQVYVGQEERAFVPIDNR